jgi:hypothetical protein
MGRDLSLRDFLDILRRVSHLPFSDGVTDLDAGTSPGYYRRGQLLA